MTLTASTLIEDGELMAYPFIPFPPAPRGMLLRALGNLDAEIMRLLMAEAPHVVSAAAAAKITIVVATNAAGYTVDAGFQHQQFTYEDANGILTPIDMVTLDREDDRSATHPAGLLINQATFKPIDPLGKRWAGGEARSFYPAGSFVNYRLAAAPAVPTTLADTMSSPDSARDYFVHAIKLAVLLQHPAVPPDVLEDARDRVRSERLLVISHAHVGSPIESRFGEKNVGVGSTRRVLR